jgi:hypothetical protein
MHRRWWARILTFLVLGAVIALSVVWVWRYELGIVDYVPAEVRQFFEPAATR